MSETWWNFALRHLAERLPGSILSEMKQRIQRGRIQKQELQLNENTARMKAFFEREIDRYDKRKQHMMNRAKLAKEQEVELEKLSKQLAHMTQVAARLTRQNKTLLREVQVLRPVLKKMIKEFGTDNMNKFMAK
jgi:hypothetical protein